MSIVNPLFSSAILFFISSYSIEAGSFDCSGGKCLASFTHKTSSQEEKGSSFTIQKKERDQNLMLTAYHQTETYKQIKPFKKNIPITKNNFSNFTTDIPQNEILVDDEPIILSSEILQEEAILPTLNYNEEAPLEVQYECNEEKEILICSTDLKECECV